MQTTPVEPLPLGGIVAPPAPQKAILPSDGERININTADQATLELLPSIGPVKSRAILEYRKKNGAFHNIDELMQVKGIVKKLFRKCRNIFVWSNQFVSKLVRYCYDTWLAYPLACLIFSFVLGIFVGGFFLPSQKISILFFLAALALLVIALWRKHYAFLLFVAYFAGCLWFGFGYYNYDNFMLEPGTQVAIEGRILETTGQTAEKCSFYLRT